MSLPTVPMTFINFSKLLFLLPTQQAYLVFLIKWLDILNSILFITPIIIYDNSTAEHDKFLNLRFHISAVTVHYFIIHNY